MSKLLKISSLSGEYSSLVTLRQVIFNHYWLDLAVCKKKYSQAFTGSKVQGFKVPFFPELHLECVFTIKASVSSGLIQHLKLNWQLPGKMNICNEDFESSMPSLSLTLNVEP
jgi:hypothetical protein